jgi:energy-coupling factor transporter ATP-binding protein EcfA2
VSQLALDLRPTKLADVLGNDSAKRALQSFIDRDSFPNVFLFSGPPGTGKTTLAQIVATAIAGSDGNIHEINGSVQNKVEDAREFAEIAESNPFNGRPRVFILNEFHRFTDQAQDALKDPMEKTSARWLITTDVPEKISAAIRSRASAATFELKPLCRPDIALLLTRATPKGTDCLSIADKLDELDVKSPREILGVVDQYLAGVPLEEAVHGAEHEPLYHEVSAAVLSGNWNKTASLLKQIKTPDFRAMVAVVSAKLSWALLDESVGPRADALSACLVGIGNNASFQDGVSYGSLRGLLYKTTKLLGANR